MPKCFSGLNFPHPEPTEISFVNKILILSFPNVVCTLSIEVDKQHYTSAITPFEQQAKWKESEAQCFSYDSQWRCLGWFKKHVHVVRFSCLFICYRTSIPSALQWTRKKVVLISFNVSPQMRTSEAATKFRQAECNLKEFSQSTAYSRDGMCFRVLFSQAKRSYS